MAQRAEQIKGQPLQDLGVEISKHLPEWSYLAPSKEFEYHNEVIRLGKDGLVIAIRHDWNDRFSVSCWEWPSFTSAEKTVHDSALGEIPAIERITPNSLYDPRESSPEIPVSPTKTPEKIAADITRRLIPDYERVYARCAEKAKLNQDYADATTKNWREVCEVVGGNPKHRVIYHHYDGEKGYFTITRSGDQARLEGYVTAEQLKKIIKALK